MTPQSKTPRREPASAPTHRAAPTTASGGTLRRVAPASSPPSAPTPAQLAPVRNVAVIAQIPNFTVARAPAQIPLGSTVASAASRPIAASPPASPSDVPVAGSSGEATNAAQPIASPVAASKPPLATTTISESPPTSPNPPPTAVDVPTPTTAEKVTPADRLRWLEKLPEWQRLGLQAIVMVAAAIFVVVAFAWWRNPDSKADPLPRRPAAVRENDGELRSADVSPATSTTSVARKLHPRSRSTPAPSIPDEAPQAAALLLTEQVEAPASVPAPPQPSPPQPSPPQPSPPQPSPPQLPKTTSPPPTPAPSVNSGPSHPVLNSPDRAAYPSYPTTDPQRYQFRAPEYDAEGGGTAVANRPRVGDDQPSAETARLGEITPLGSGNIR